MPAAQIGVRLPESQAPPRRTGSAGDFAGPEEYPAMPRYRYRTATLVGPWRDSRLKAETDAVAVGQAKLEGRDARLVWTVPGEIEVGDDGRVDADA